MGKKANAADRSFFYCIGNTGGFSSEFPKKNQIGRKNTGSGENLQVLIAPFLSKHKKRQFSRE